MLAATLRLAVPPPGKRRRVKFRLRFPHLMELKSFFSPLTMERKAAVAGSEGFLWSEWITDFGEEKEQNSRI